MRPRAVPTLASTCPNLGSSWPVWDDGVDTFRYDYPRQKVPVDERLKLPELQRIAANS